MLTLISSHISKSESQLDPDTPCLYLPDNGILGSCHIPLTFVSAEGPNSPFSLCDKSFHLSRLPGS